MKIYNEVYFSFEGWYWHIEDDIKEAWYKRFGEELVISTLTGLREWLKTRPKFQETIDKGYGGNWVFWIWDRLEQAEIWKKEREVENEKKTIT